MKTFKLFILCLLLISTLIHAQDDGDPTVRTRAPEFYQKGEAAMLQGNLKKAINHFEKAISEKPEMIVSYRALGTCLEAINDYKGASEQYEKMLSYNTRFSRVIYYDLALAHYKSGDYHKALKYFEEFESLLHLPPDDFGFNGIKEQPIEQAYIKELPISISSCKAAIDQARYSNIKEVVNIGAPINTAFDEYFPFLSNDQKTIFFTTRANKSADENLFFSTSVDQTWNLGQPIVGGFNTPNNEGMSTITRDGQQMFFTACQRADGLGHCDILTAKMDSTTVISIGKLEGYANSAKWESQASINCDGSLLYFSSTRNGGLGGSDIWFSKRLADGSWSEAKNAGPMINTKLDEEAPFISDDGQTLYFSSNGHLGLGEQDLFFSRMGENDLWGAAINLGAPVNTASRELGFFLSADGKTGYFSSNRKGGLGGMDIYKFELSEFLFANPITFAEGFVKDSITKEPIQTILYPKDRNPIFTDENGRFFLCIPAEEKLSFSITESEYHSYKINKKIPAWDNREFFPLEVLLQPIIEPIIIATVKKIQELPEPLISTPTPLLLNIYFGFDQADLNIEAKNKVDELISKIKNPEIKSISISGYSDPIGSETYNLKLSELRAENVATYLLESGIESRKIEIEGLGEIQDETQSAIKRKVEIKVIF